MESCHVLAAALALSKTALPSAASQLGEVSLTTGRLTPSFPEGMNL